MESSLKTETQKEQIRLAAESSLEFFINLIAPHRVLGSVHRELINWWTRQDALPNQLTLLPRDHGKSSLIAYRVAWAVVKQPDVRILYISATSDLAEKQLKMVKDILTSSKVRMYWPQLINLQESKREKWTNTEIAVDHPLRKKEQVRDPTVKIGGLTTSLTGFHCDIAVLDDIVVRENAYTELGRSSVSAAYSLLASVEAANAEEWAVGTRYHPRDLYNDLMTMEEEVFDENGEVTSVRPIYEVFERQVEDIGDGSGQFLWPRQQRYDGKWFGFDRQILAAKKAKYQGNMGQFRAQYYNNPNNPDGAGIKRELFQYYDKAFLSRKEGFWYMKGKRLNIVSAIDFAYSLSKRSDYTALVIIGIDADFNIYVLDVVRFKTEKISDYFKEIHRAYVRWDFRKIRAEITVAQKTIVTELKDNYFRTFGLPISIVTSAPTRNEGSKAERMRAILEPRYCEQKIWHYMGGNCQILEDELVLEHPAHDDVKDALSAAIEIASAPASRRQETSIGNVLPISARFGGISRRG